MLLLVKLTLTPALVAAATLAGRRWGPAVAGLLAGLPIVAGPILFFYGLENGEAFAVQAAAKTMLGIVSLAFFCVVYAWSSVEAQEVADMEGYRASPLRIFASLAAGWAAFAAGALLFSRISLAWRQCLVLSLAGLAAARLLLPVRRARAEGVVHMAVRHHPWDLPVRMVAASALVLTLTSLAQRLGPAWSGLLTPFPVASTIMVVGAHQSQGPTAVVRVLAGLLTGLLGFAFFCAVLASRLPAWGLFRAFAAGLAVVLAVQALALLNRNQKGIHIPSLF